jgi:hypothetical protein
MKHLMLVLAACMMVLVACKEKKHVNDGIITTDYEMPKPSEAPIAMPAQTNKVEVEWKDSRYAIAIARTPADSLSKVTDEIGQQYIDNVVKISITRSDGTSFFNRSFAKSAFMEWLEDDYRHHAVLEDITFFGVEGQELVFTAALNHPAASDDEAIDLRLSVNAQGQVNIGLYDDNQRDDLKMSDAE